LHWLLFIHWNIFQIEDNILDIGIPFFLPIIPIYIWLRPGVNLISSDEDLQHITESGQRFRIQMIAGITIIFATTFAQLYMETATGKMTNINKVTQINDQEATKYYSIDTFYLNEKNASIQKYAYTTGKHQDGLQYSIYALIPMYNQASDTLLHRTNAWLGVKYDKHYSNYISQSEKHDLWQNFINECQYNLHSQYGEYAKNFLYLVREDKGENDYKIYNFLLVNSGIKSSENNFILLPINEPFEARNGHKLLWALTSFFIGTLLFLFMLRNIKFDEIDLKNFKYGSNKLY